MTPHPASARPGRFAVRTVTATLLLLLAATIVVAAPGHTPGAAAAAAAIDWASSHRERATR